MEIKFYYSTYIYIFLIYLYYNKLSYFKVKINYIFYIYIYINKIFKKL